MHFLAHQLGPFLVPFPTCFHAELCPFLLSLYCTLSFPVQLTLHLPHPPPFPWLQWPDLFQYDHLPLSSSGSCVPFSVPTSFPIFSQCSLLVYCEHTGNIQHISIILPEYSVTTQNAIFTNTNMSTSNSQHWYFKTGASHLDDTAYTIEYAFKTDETEEDKEMSNLLLDVWSSFAATG